MRVDALFIYPVKSCRGIRLDAVSVEQRGFHLDRRWVIADRQQDYKFLTQRSHPALAHIDVQIDAAGHLILRTAGLDPLHVTAQTGELVQIPMWKETAPAVDLGDEAAGWLQAALGDAAIAPRLCYQRDGDFRPVDPVYGEPDDPLSFADGSPVLIINQASLDDLNGRLPEPTQADRFRPNIVVSGLAAFAEDQIATLRIGDMVFDLVNACDRCKIVTLDQQTGVQDAPERNPLKALGEYRRGDKGKIYFGIDAIPRGTGTLKTGDGIEILAQQDIAHHLKDAA